MLLLGWCGNRILAFGVAKYKRWMRPEAGEVEEREGEVPEAGEETKEEELPEAGVRNREKEVP